ncbi:DUF4199 domain-containing protein [Poritiphilus flavus]|uniref:DUF4199 family protein n=1 Tax=Poritiphilus flavus TaxID=2697053 RepID=A0A6L9EBA3_9FLAO|nr:DUF4199 domain-containing protein [Poritiphilus flavus]NAS11851.1 DUF4199 family protein [Poritiphilus flavus]
MAKLKTALIYGFVVALAGTALLLTLIAFKLIGPEAIALETEMTGGTILFLMLYLFLLFAIYFAIKKRKETLGRGIKYREAFVQGLIVSAATAIFSVVFTVIFYEILYPSYVIETLEALRLKMETAGVKADMLNAKLEEKAAYLSTSTQSFYAFVGNLITGLAFTLLLSFFLKSNTKNEL